MSYVASRGALGACCSSCASRGEALGGSVLAAVTNMVTPPKAAGRTGLQAMLAQTVAHLPPQQAIIKPVPERDVSAKMAGRAALQAQMAQAVAALPTASSRTMMYAGLAAAVGVGLYAITRTKRRKRSR